LFDYGNHNSADLGMRTPNAEELKVFATLNLIFISFNHQFIKRVPYLVDSGAGSFGSYFGGSGNGSGSLISVSGFGRFV